MEKLRELINVVSPERLSTCAILGQSGNKELDAFYNLLVDESVDSDEMAMKKIFRKRPSTTAYKQFKQQMENRLVDMLFLIDVNVPVNGRASLAYEAAWRLWAAANLMILQNILGTGVEYAKKALALAMEYEHPDLVMQIAKVLRRVYATYSGDQQGFEHYDALYKQYATLVRVEAKVEECYEKVLMMSAQPDTSQAEVTELARTVLTDLEPLLETYSTSSIHRHIRYIQATYLLNIGAYEELLEKAKEAVSFFRSKTFDLSHTELGFLALILMALIELKDAERGAVVLKECRDLLGDEVTFNYFKVHELGYIMFMQCGAYQQAYDFCVSIFNEGKLDDQNEHLKLTWQVYGAFLQYFADQGLIERRADDTWSKQYRWARFLKLLPTPDQDQRELHAPLVMIQILVAISNKKYGLAADRIGSLSVYNSKYVKKDGHFRSNCFVNMLMQLPVAGFHRAATQRYAAKFHSKLSESVLCITDPAQEIEIIPYERFWQLLLDKLPTKRIKINHSKHKKVRTT